jgi:hypothetical protein
LKAKKFFKPVINSKIRKITHTKLSNNTHLSFILVKFRKMEDWVVENWVVGEVGEHRVVARVPWDIIANISIQFTIKSREEEIEHGVYNKISRIIVV